MSYSDNSIFSKALNPFVQVIIVLSTFLGLLAIANVLEIIGITTLDPAFAWTLAAAFLLFFAVFNSVFSLSAANDNAYWVKSFISFAVYAAMSGLVAYFVAGISIEEIGPYRWIYTVITFVYLVFISIIGFMKKIVQFAQREEWTKPMRRSKNKK